MTTPIVYNPYNAKNRLFTKSDIQAISQFTISNQTLYQTAMVHSSYVKRSEYISPTGEPTQLAGVVVSSYLIERYPDENEGFITNLKKEIVCNEMLGTLSQKIGLDKFYIISKHNEEVCNGRTNIKKLGDILEAFIGALWIDSKYNFKVVYKFIVNLIEKHINIPKILMNNRNYKEQLQKVYQARHHYTPTYVMLSSSTNMYTMAVADKNGAHIGIGSATTKKQAEQLAAKEALRVVS